MGVIKSVVPTIIKWLAITIIVLILGVCTIEFINIHNTLLEFTQLNKKLCQTAAAYFCQESYFGDTDSQKVGRAYDLIGNTSDIKIDGNWYAKDGVSTNTTQEIIDRLYTNSEAFEDYWNTVRQQILDKQNDAGVSGEGLLDADNIKYSGKQVETGVPNYVGINNALAIFSDDNFGDNNYKDVYIKGLHMTPLNLGFTYLDEEVVSNIYRWLLANELSAESMIIGGGETRRYNIRKDADGIYVKWKGFRVYLDEDTTIKLSKPTVYNISDPIESTKPGEEGSYTDADRLMALTNVDILNSLSSYPEEDASGYKRRRWQEAYEGTEGDSSDPNYLEYNHLTKYDIRSYKIVYTIDWGAKIAYEGILPFKRILDFTAYNYEGKAVSGELKFNKLSNENTLHWDGLYTWEEYDNYYNSSALDNPMHSDYTNYAEGVTSEYLEGGEGIISENAILCGPAYSGLDPDSNANDTATNMDLTRYRKETSTIYNYKRGENGQQPTLGLGTGIHYCFWQ